MRSAARPGGASGGDGAESTRAGTVKTPLPRPLRGVRVLDVSTMIAGPSAAALLAEFGADVVKVEHPQAGDHLRRFGAAREGEGLYFKSLSRNKRSVALDLHDPEVQALVLRWIARFDALIENFRPGTLERWNLGPDRLLARAPHLVVLRVTGFGQNGPYRDRAGFGTLAEALSGFASMTGYPDRPPVLPPAALADIMAGQLGASAVLAALLRARETGEGEVIDLAIYEAMLKLVDVNVIEYDQLGIVPERRGNQSGSTSPRGAYRCADGGWVALSGSAQPVADRLLRAVGGDALAADPRFATNAARLEHNEELDAILAAWFAARARDEAIETLNALGCAVGPLETIPSMLENPQVRARESIVTVDDPRLGPIRMTGAFPRFERSEPARFETGPGSIGRDTARVLRDDLGLDEHALGALAERGAARLG